MYIRLGRGSQYHQIVSYLFLASWLGGQVLQYSYAVSLFPSKILDPPLKSYTNIPLEAILMCHPPIQHLVACRDLLPNASMFWAVVTTDSSIIFLVYIISSTGSSNVASRNGFPISLMACTRICVYSWNVVF